MSGAEADATLLQALATERDAAGELLDALRDENHALRRRDAAALEQAVELKSRAARSLSEASARRSAAASAVDLPAGIGGLPEAIARSHGQRTALHEMAAELLSLAEQLQTLNEINGRVVELGRQSVNQMLDVLRGGSGDAPATVYGADGSASSSARDSGTRPLARI